jgi:hypothetical protein
MSNNAEIRGQFVDLSGKIARLSVASTFSQRDFLQYQ